MISDCKVFYSFFRLWDQLDSQSKYKYNPGTDHQNLNINETNIS